LGYPDTTDWLGYDEPHPRARPFLSLGCCMSKRVLISAVAMSLMAFGMAGSAYAETLADAIAMAYANNPSLQRARAQQRGADEGYVQARSQLGPSASFSFDKSYHDRDQSFAAGSQRSTQGLGFSASQTLFSTGGISSQIDAAKSGVLAGQQDLRSIEQQMLLSVIDIYTAVRRDQEALQISQDNYNILKQQLDQTTAQFEAGQLTRTDVAQSQARLSQSAAGLAQAQARLDSDRASYVAIVGQAPTALEPVTEIPGLPGSFNAALDTAQTNNPDLQAASFAADAAGSRVKAARSVFGPRVGLSVTSSQSGFSGALGSFEDEQNTTAGLRLTVPLFSAGLNGSRVREAMEGETAAKLSVEETRRTVVSTVSQAWSNMIAARSAVVSNQEQVRAAAVAAEGVKTEQQVGLRTNIEVLNAEQEYRAAQLDLVNAQRSAYVAAAQLVAVTGNLTPAAFGANVETYDPNANFKRVKNKGWTPLEPVVHFVDKTAAGFLPDSK
jgi:outer membrane protein